MRSLLIVWQLPLAVKGGAGGVWKVVAEPTGEEDAVGSCLTNGSFANRIYRLCWAYRGELLLDFGDFPE